MAETLRRPNPTQTGHRPGADGAADRPAMDDLTPAAIVTELDKYIIGQSDAKRAVAVALRNRYRRQLLPDDLRQEVQPKNILMIGPTGVGKTEIARRVAKIVDAPFLKVEATKFTEVGYVGRDVESIVRDLVEVAISMLHGERMEQVKDEATRAAVQRLADLLATQSVERKPVKNGRRHAAENATPEDAAALQRQELASERRLQRERKRLLNLLDQQALEEETVEIEIDPEGEYEEYGPLDFVSGMTPEDLHDTFHDFLDGLVPRRPYRRRVSVREARRILTQQESNRLVDFDAVVEAAIGRVENAAVVFLDEIDKTIASDGDYGGDVSGAGVQRDLLPIVEGSVVVTRYGPVKTDHILFIAAGAFHDNRPSDLIPELQGRFPIRVELSSLSEADLYAILTEPANALTKQYHALLATEGLTLAFAESGMREMARLATLVNSRTEDIGARRLHTILEKVLEEVSFDAPSRSGETVTIDAGFVAGRVGEVAADDDLSSFIL
ncbi:MAG: ATP-dependent hsl protease ATP-binding subunit HslU [uncultured Thermomicrobiales bacterium]|uniref:ATP-dependent hsl protease ATP-binding subunit HslU n=1 Tax=uncultured Thermomicrobiales bacterium TaxID=1645740 RepID=A0A6J4UZL4_9BACT|nr:MAG: ATP-dependent hsl protease ATP-binding subunit HslU [uncultured Thermomicrobiales bacterium]